MDIRDLMLTMVRCNNMNCTNQRRDPKGTGYCNLKEIKIEVDPKVPGFYAECKEFNIQKEGK